MRSRSAATRSLFSRLNRRRRAVSGASLIELMATITVTTLIATASVGAIRTLFLVERRAAASVDEQTARWRFLQRWNADVRGAVNAAIVESPDLGDSAWMRLGFPDGVEVVYRAELNRVVRVHMSGVEIRTEAFRSGSSWWCRFRVTDRQCEVRLGRSSANLTGRNEGGSVDVNSATLRMASWLGNEEMLSGRNEPPGGSGP